MATEGSPPPEKPGLRFNSKENAEVDAKSAWSQAKEKPVRPFAERQVTAINEIARYERLKEAGRSLLIGGASAAASLVAFYELNLVTHMARGMSHDEMMVTIAAEFVAAGFIGLSHGGIRYFRKSGEIEKTQVAAAEKLK